MKLKQLNKKGALSLGDAPSVVFIVGFIFLLMATVAYVGDEYATAIADDNAGAGCNSSHKTSCGSAYNVTQDMNQELDDNTSIAGIVLTISLVGIVLSILVGIFVASRRGGM